MTTKTMEGLYFYCIRKIINTPFSFSTNGIDEKEKVFTLPYGELEAVVSKVSLEEFNPEAIQIKAQEDLKWIKEKALIHEKVIEEAMRKNGEIISLIPMKFGAIFKEEKGLEKVLNKDYEKFKATIEKLEGKQEWSLKVYFADRAEFEQALKTASETVREKEREMASLSEGMAYFMEEELREIIKKETDDELKKIRKNLLEEFKLYAEEIKEGKILEKELTGRPEPMVLNTSCLIEREKIAEFKSAVSRINETLKMKGLNLEYSGPWPPYNFV